MIGMKNHGLREEQEILTRDEDSQGPTEPADSPATNPSNNATGSGGDTGVASAEGVASAAVAAVERTRGDEEMAALGSATNATYERDTDVIATPPKHVVRRIRGLRRRVRLETEEGEEEMSVLSDHHVEINVGPAGLHPEEEEGEDPRAEIEALFESERLPEENARRSRCRSQGST